jgi:hypothetical protein
MPVCALDSSGSWQDLATNYREASNEHYDQAS